MYIQWPGGSCLHASEAAWPCKNSAARPHRSANLASQRSSAASPTPSLSAAGREGVEAQPLQLTSPAHQPAKAKESSGA